LRRSPPAGGTQNVAEDEKALCLTSDVKHNVKHTDVKHVALIFCSCILELVGFCVSSKNGAKVSVGTPVDCTDWFKDKNDE